MRAGQVAAGRYRLDRQIGAGSFAEVWAARLATTGARVALKIARPPVADGVAARLAREARVVARVHHPRVARLLDRLEDEQALVYELVDGPSLATMLEQGPRLAPVDALAMTADILGALAATHDAGIVHRDVAPANILHDPARGTWTLIDFGVALVVGEAQAQEDALTTDDAALGSLVHQAPEQVDDAHHVDARADLYGLGSTLFTALAGRAPFRAASMAVLLSLKSVREAPSLAEVSGTAWPAPVETFLRRLLAREPAARFATAAVAADACAALRRELA